MCFCSCICTESLHSSLVNSYISRWVNQSFGHADVIEVRHELFGSHSWLINLIVFYILPLLQFHLYSILICLLIWPAYMRNLFQKSSTC
ncbi:uncharacterized protein DS421_3g89660 [Arachis hypogaea]|nr:uncharacterized protein DS421_3g89660 [Arachis hypogaea]